MRKVRKQTSFRNLRDSSEFETGTYAKSFASQMYTNICNYLKVYALSMFLL